jgi:hypothetical protein
MLSISVVSRVPGPDPTKAQLRSFHRRTRLAPRSSIFSETCPITPASNTDFYQTIIGIVRSFVLRSRGLALQDGGLVSLSRVALDGNDAAMGASVARRRDCLPTGSINAQPDCLGKSHKMNDENLPVLR